MDSMIPVAKKYLAEFEQSPNSQKGKSALINGLMQLVELKDLATDQEVKAASQTLIKTYCDQVIEKASIFTDDSFRDYELVLYWNQILREFEMLGIETSESFKKIQWELGVKYMLKDYSGEELKKIKAEFESYKKD